MIKIFFKVVLPLLIGFQAFAQKHITLEDIWKNGTFSSKGVYGFVPLNDGVSYCSKVSGKTGQFVVRYLYESGKATDTLIHTGRIARANGLPTFAFEGYLFSPDEQSVLFTCESEAIYRHSYASKCYLMDLKSCVLKPVSEKKIMYCRFDPSGSRVSWVFENNLYVKDLKSNKTKAITKDGKRNAIINGAVDWVYEEEFSMSRGYEWNSSGTAIAYYRFDETGVPEYTMPVYDGLYPKNQSFKYPKAGEPNSIVDVWVYDIKTGKVRKMQTGPEKDQYLPRILWTDDPDVLSIQRLNRLQNKWEILLCDRKTGTARVSFEETDKYYIDITDDVSYLPGNEFMLMTSERDGYRHIFLHKKDGPEVMQVTKGSWDVADILGYDDKNKQIYFSAFEVSPTEKHIYRCDLDGKNKVDLTSAGGMHSASFSRDFSFFLHTTSTLNSPPKYSICNKNGETVRMLEDNQALVNRIAEYKFSKAELGQLMMAGGYSLNYWIIKPLDFDSTRKYPLLMFVYGGPGSQQVYNAWSGSNFLWYQMLANEKGYIIACVDNRGTGSRGAEFKKMTYRQLGKYETEDQIEAARLFGKNPWIDAARIGIWGWSYGGFMSSSCLARGNDVFKAAIAVAPVTNWRYYDNIYTERYMQLPKDNAEGYDLNSPINMADKIKGNYLLIHGTGDDNVHFQNAAEMVKKLVDLNIPFESAYYPNKNHGISGGNTRLHLYTLMTRFILEKL